MTSAVDKSDYCFAAMLCLYSKNIAAEVEEALVSAFDRQSYPPSQLIVVYDGPISDGVDSVIERFSRDNDVIKIVFDQCKGHGTARAAAVNACKYDWIAVVDADDISMPDRFEKLLNLVVQYPKAAVVGGGLVEFEIEDGAMIFGHTVNYPVNSDEVRRHLARRSPIAQPTAMLRVASVKDVGNYQCWFNNEDYHLWIRLASAGYELLNVSEPIIWFRTSPHLFARRGGIRYWWNEVKLQYFSYKNGTTTVSALLTGAIIRYFVQVLMPVELRALFYRKVLRNL